ncbi:hypothetical protein RhiirB3_379866 [Rhizophagus irregularis]|nr:hypothetical protein RhiirB3_379866 [Rhizophagus irregularis]
MEEVRNRIWKFSNSMIKGNRKDVFGFKAAEEKRCLSLLTISKQIYPQVIHSQRIWNESHILRLPFLVKNDLIKFNDDDCITDTHGYSCAISIGKWVFIIIKDPSIPSISITYPNSGLINGRCIPKFNDSNIGHIVY